MMDKAPQTLLSNGCTDERREIAIVSCDLVESTALQERLGIERYRKVQDAFLQSCLDNAQSAGAETIRYTGDGLAFVFGRIQAFEYDSERAIKLAILMAETVQSICPTNQAISGRFSIATGSAIVQQRPDFMNVREGINQVRIEVVGPVLNRAYRLLEFAGVNEIVIDDLTRQLASGLFAVEDLGCHKLRGFSKSQRVWKIQGESAIESRFQALRQNVSTPLVGRENQCGLFKSLWQKIKENHAQIVLLEGEAGIGKSRLAQYITDEVLEASCQRVVLYCNPHSQGANLAPISNYFRNVCGITLDDSEKVHYEKLLSLLAGTVDEPEEAATVLSAYLLNRTDDKLTELSPQALRDRRLAFITEHLCGLSRYSPLFIMIEDIHWTDRGTLALVQQLIQQARENAILLIVTLRSDGYAESHELSLFREMFDADTSCFTRIALTPLKEHESMKLIHLFFNETKPDPGVTQQIIERADGNPLFIEDLSRCVLDAGGLLKHDDTTSPEGVPAVLWHSLMARLDRLNEAKRIAQFASVIGREFPTILLKQLACLSDEVLSFTLSLLCDAGIMQAHPQDSCSYMFCHALVRDTAYYSLLEEDRGDLHWQVAELLSKHDSAVKRLQPDLLALHYEKAANLGSMGEEQVTRYRRAADYWFEAGQLSADRSEYEEALVHLQRAVDTLNKVDAPAYICRFALMKRLEVMTEIVRVQVTCYGFSSPDVHGTLNDSFELCAKLGNPENILDLYTLSVGHYITAGNLRAANDSAEKAFSAIKTASTTNPRHVVIANRAMSGVRFLSGEFFEAINHTDEVILHYDAHQDAIIEQDGRMIIDHKIVALCYKQISLAVMGNAKQMLNTGVLGLEHASSLGHSQSTAFAKTFYCAALYLLQGPDTRKQIENTLEYVKHQRFANFVGILTMLLGSALVDEGVVTQDQDLIINGIQVLSEGTTAHTEIHATTYQPLGCGFLAAARLQVGCYAEALRTVEKGLEIARATGEVWYAPELLRIKGECLASLPDEFNRDLILSVFESALIEAKGQNAHLWQLRTYLSICHLAEKLGIGDRYTNALQQVHDALDKGIDFPALASAKQYLAIRS